MRDLVLGLGVLAVAEGLLLVLLPGRLEDIIRAIERTSKDQRQIFGLCIMAMGVLLILLAKEFF